MISWTGQRAVAAIVIMLNTWITQAPSTVDAARDGVAGAVREDARQDQSTGSDITILLVIANDRDRMCRGCEHE
jgi:hypothetical protein